MNGLNGQGHLKGGYSHEDRVMKNGSTGSNSSKRQFEHIIKHKSRYHKNSIKY
jgi:hypothetical protein